MHFALGHCPQAVTPGKILRLIDLRAHPDFAASPAAAHWDARPDIVNISVLILGVSEAKIDVLEMLYTELPNFDRDLPGAIIGVALSEAWGMRAPGMILGLIGKFGVKNRLKSESFEHNILSPSNPYALSRSQQKVCQLLAAGQKPAEIATLLGVSITTVRSHLANIYAKTSTSGQSEVIALIDGGGREADAGEAN